MKSIFTDDFNRCAVTKMYKNQVRLELHHVFRYDVKKEVSRVLRDEARENQRTVYK